MARFDLKPEAWRMRRSGCSINEISKALGIAKSTASLWCRECSLTKTQQDNLFERMERAGQKGRLKGAQMQREKRLERSRLAKKQAEEIAYTYSSEPDFWLGLGLFWGEGTKTLESTLAFVNADVSTVRFMKCWFEQYFSVPGHDFNPYVYINQDHSSRSSVIAKVWEDALGLQKQSGVKIYTIKAAHKKQFVFSDTYVGTCSLRIKRSSHLRDVIHSLLAVAKDTAGKK